MGQIPPKPTASEEVNELIEHQKRSAAVETLFTIALLLFAGSQLMVTVYSATPTMADLIFLIATPITTLSVIVIALLIGGENLYEVVRDELD